MGVVDRYNRWIESITPNTNIRQFKNKQGTANLLNDYTLLRLLKMFEYNGLPSTIPQYVLEFYLLTVGHCCIAQNDGALYAYVGGLGGEPNVYYQPTLYVVANPAQKLSKTFVIDEDCVLCKNDYLLRGIYPLINMYNSELAENHLSMHVNGIMKRITDIIKATSDDEKLAADKYLMDIVNGEIASILSDETMFNDGFVTQPFGSKSTASMTELIEYHQYIKASLYNEIGLNANYNMKREAIMSGESELNHDALVPLVDMMLEARKEFCEKVNNLFGTDITVELSSAWGDNRDDVELAHEEVEAEIDNLEAETEQVETETEQVKEGETDADNGKVEGTEEPPAGVPERDKPE